MAPILSLVSHAIRDAEKIKCLNIEKKSLPLKKVSFELALSAVVSSKRKAASTGFAADARAQRIGVILKYNMCCIPITANETGLCFSVLAEMAG